MVCLCIFARASFLLLPCSGTSFGRVREGERRCNFAEADAADAVNGENGYQIRPGKPGILGYSMKF